MSKNSLSFGESPIQGTIYPGKSVEISVIFKPEKIRCYEKQIFCDVQGREQRLPLNITALAIGPELALRYNLKVSAGKIPQLTVHLI